MIHMFIWKVITLLKRALCSLLSAPFVRTAFHIGVVTALGAHWTGRIQMPHLFLSYSAQHDALDVIIIVNVT